MVQAALVDCSLVLFSKLANMDYKTLRSTNSLPPSLITMFHHLYPTPHPSPLAHFPNIIPNQTHTPPRLRIQQAQ